MTRKRVKIMIILIIGCCLIFCLYHKLFKEKIQCETIHINFFKNNINTKEFLEGLQEEDFWNENNYKIKNIDFEYMGDDSEYEKAFTAYYQIKFDKSLKDKVKNVGYEINFTDDMNYLCVMHNGVVDNPFDNFATHGRKDGAYIVIINGIMSGKSEDEIIKILKKCSISLYIEYSDGKIEEKKVHFGDALIETNHFDGKHEKHNDFVYEWGYEINEEQGGSDD